MAGPIVKGILRTAGTALGSYLDEALSIGGKVGQKAATGILDAGKRAFAPSLVGASAADTPELLRGGARSVIPRAGRLIGQGATIGGAMYLGSLADQQTDNTQPMAKGMDTFLQSQALQNQKFMHEMMLIQNRQESRTPKNQQYGGLGPDDFETNKEVLGVARSLYGTGLRAY